MVRASRNVGQLRAEVKRFLHQSNSTIASNFNDDLILDCLNRRKDLREMQLQNRGEGFSITVHSADLVADQEEYSIPAQGGRFRRVLRYIASVPVTIPLEREEKWTQATYTGGEYSDESYVPTYRLLDNHIILSPPPTVAVTNGLQIEMEASTDRLSEDSDTIPDSWPLFAETLLVYDVVLELIHSSDALISNADQTAVAAIEADKAIYESSWAVYVDKRSFGPQYSTPLEIDLLM